MNTELISIGIILMFSLLFLLVMVKPNRFMSNRKKSFSKYFNIEDLLISVLIVISLLIITIYNQISILSNKGISGLIIMTILVIIVKKRVDND
jgi:hypothetical protein